MDRSRGRGKRERERRVVEEDERNWKVREGEERVVVRGNRR